MSRNRKRSRSKEKGVNLPFLSKRCENGYNRYYDSIVSSWSIHSYNYCCYGNRGNMNREKLIAYLKTRTELLGCIASYYETLERDKGLLRTDEQASYNIALAQLGELDRLVKFIENL